MKTFGQFCVEAYKLDEFKVGAVMKGAGRIGAELAADELSKKMPKPVKDLVDIGLSGVGMGPLAVPAMGVTAATKLLSPIGRKVHKVKSEIDAIKRDALSKAPSTKNMSPGEREEIVRGTRLRGV